MNGLAAPQGRAYWAVAPFAPEPPFRLHVADGGAPIEVADAQSVCAAAAKGGGSAFTMLIPVKPRPVLVISGNLAPFDEVIALRLKRLGTLTETAAERVRTGADEALMALPAEEFPGLELENAAIVTSMLRLPLTALDTGTELGVLNQSDLITLHDRVARSIGLRLDVPILAKAQELLRELGSAL